MSKQQRHLFKLQMTTAITAIGLLAVEPAHALPQGGQVVGGAASISSAGSQLTVQQSTQRAVINWQNFDISAGEHVVFQQPSASSVTLNRVTGGMGASQLLGNLTANGTLMLVNPNGVFIGPSAQINVGSIVATSADIPTERFMAGDDRFYIAGNPNAGIVNQGIVTAADAGLVALIAPNVINDGYIQAKLGKVQLASGDTFALDLYGDGLVSLEASDAVTSQLVRNSGIISANGGQVIMTAAAASEMVNSVINMEGIIEATSVAERNGEIIIFAEGSNAVKSNNSGSKGKKKGNSTVLVSGVLDASGRKAGESGGKITVTGDNVALLNGTIIDASGHTGVSGTTAGKAVSAYRERSAGGDIRIGGDYLGQGDTPTAQNLYVDSGALILNESLFTGDAGRTIFWSDGSTQFYGNVYARALGGLAVDALTWNATQGGNAGDGGFVETSGHQYLDAQGYVDLTASNGRKGTYFLDPNDITIYGNVDPAFVSTDGGINLSSSLRQWLDVSDTTKVTLTYSTDALSAATATGTSGNNTITTSTDVSANLAVGVRIRLGSAGSVTTADTIGADTYIISAISGTTITLSSNLTQNYSGSTVYRGLVSQITDKSAQNNTTIQTTESRMPLWIGNGQNGKAIAVFDGVDDLLVKASFSLGSSGVSGNNLSGFHALQEVSALNYPMFWVYAPGQVEFRMFASTGHPEVIAVGELMRLSSNQVGNNIIMSGVLNNAADTGNLWINGAQGTQTGTGVSIPDTADNYVGARSQGAYHANMKYYESITYNSVLSDTSRNLVEQYQSAKWGIALTPPGTGATEVAKATAADGYSVFTTRYLERLSQSANISLQATNSITLDFKGDILSLAADRSLTLATTNGNITSASAGAINTSRTAAGGNITMTSGGAGTINVSNITLTASSGGVVTLNGVVQVASTNNVPSTEVARMFQTLSPQNNFPLSTGESSQGVLVNSNESESDSGTGNQQANIANNTNTKLVLPESVSPEILIDPELQRLLGLPEEL